MTEAELQDFCQDMAQAVLDGRLDTAADAYIYPLAVYRPDGVKIEQARQDTIMALADRQAQAKAHGAVAVDAELLDIDHGSSGRIVLLVHWCFLGPDAKFLDRTILRYFCRFDGAGMLKIEMLELQKLAFGETSRDWDVPDNPH